MTHTDYESKGSTIELNPILSLIADGPKTAAYLYNESGLEGETGREMGRLMTAGKLTRVGSEFMTPSMAEAFKLAQLFPEMHNPTGPNPEALAALTALVVDLVN